MQTIERTWDRNEKENTVSKCFASLCFSETMWRTYNDKKRTSATNDNKLHYILNRIRIPIDAERNTLSWENPHEKYQRHFISHAGFFPFVRSFFSSWRRLFEFISLDCWFSSKAKPSKASCRCACWYRFNDENVATAARVVQYIRYENDDESKVKCTHSTQEKYSFFGNKINV